MLSNSFVLFFNFLLWFFFFFYCFSLNMFRNSQLNFVFGIVKELLRFSRRTNYSSNITKSLDFLAANKKDQSKLGWELSEEWHSYSFSFVLSFCPAKLDFWSSWIFFFTHFVSSLTSASSTFCLPLSISICGVSPNQVRSGTFFHFFFSGARQRSTILSNFKRIQRVISERCNWKKNGGRIWRFRVRSSQCKTGWLSDNKFYR